SLRASVRGLFPSPLFGPRCGAGGANVAAVGAPRIPIDPAQLIHAQLQPIQQPLKRPILLPASKTVVNALPGTIPLGKIAPACPGVQRPEHRVQQLAMRPPLSSPTPGARILPAPQPICP